jgi:hypothetical protein
MVKNCLKKSYCRNNLNFRDLFWNNLLRVHFVTNSAGKYGSFDTHYGHQEKNLTLYSVLLTFFRTKKAIFYKKWLKIKKLQNHWTHLHKRSFPKIYVMYIHLLKLYLLLHLLKEVFYTLDLAIMFKMLLLFSVCCSRNKNPNVFFSKRPPIK